MRLSVGQYITIHSKPVYYWHYSDPLCKAKHKVLLCVCVCERSRSCGKPQKANSCHVFHYSGGHQAVVVVEEEEMEAESVSAELMESEKCIWTRGSPGGTLVAQTWTDFTSADGESKIKSACASIRRYLHHNQMCTSLLNMRGFFFLFFRLRLTFTSHVFQDFAIKVRNLELCVNLLRLVRWGRKQSVFYLDFSIFTLFSLPNC